MTRLLTVILGFFIIRVAFAQAPLDYALQVSGPKTVYAGSDLYVRLSTTYLTANPKTHLYFVGVSSLPLGSSYELWCNDYQHCWVDTKRKIPYMYQGTNPTMFRLRTSPDTPPGSYTVSVKTENSGVQREVQIPVTVLLAPIASAQSSLPVTYDFDIETASWVPRVVKPPVPPLPQAVVNKWETTMMQLASKWCPSSNQIMHFGVETEVWYYDGPRVFFQVADYSKNLQWEACAIHIAKQYRDYVVSSNGLILGSRVFPHGLYMAWQRTKDPSFRDALLLLAEKGTWAPKGGSLDETSIRETAYILQTYVFAQKAGAPRHQLMDRSVSYLLGHFDVLFNGGDAKIHQLFYDGLAAHALADYYELTQDARIIPTIKMMLDWVYKNAWNAQQKTLLINPEPLGPKCTWGCQQPNTDLINLLVPAFAWYSRITGDAQYLTRGDEIFSASLNSDITYSGKIFSQNFRWSYIKVRE